MTNPLFYVDRLEQGTVTVTGTEAHHAVAVKRLRAGEPVDLADGRGRVGRGVVVSTAKDRLEVDVSDVIEAASADPWFVVVQALPKGDRADLAVEALTEVGVDEVVPWRAIRCVVRWDSERRARGLERWRATAREAGKQSRRPRLPAIAEVATTDDVVARIATATLAIVLHEEATDALGDVDVPERGEVVLVVGPEGGIASEELKAFQDAGALTARLGPSVLRTSTAGAVGAAVLLSKSSRWR